LRTRPAPFSAEGAGGAMIAVMAAAMLIVAVVAISARGSGDRWM
jgi:hypothetical protein